jgi:uncharacterized protein (DUF1501 family)
MHVNRREFLRRSIRAALGGASLYSALGNLRLVAAAARQNAYAFGDYKALVCVYLYGGNDSFNTIVPYDTAHYGSYSNSRQGLALAKADIQSNNLNAVAASGGLPGGLPSDGGSYGLHPAMGDLSASGGNQGLRSLFNSGQVAIVANVGTLVQPVSQLSYQNGTAALPPQLLSHVDQQGQWQTSRSDDTSANGWGGRIADLLYATNSGQVPMSISLSGNNLYQRGATVNQYSVDPSGVTAMSYLGNGPESWIVGDAPTDDDTAAYNALIAAGTQSHVLERAFAGLATRAITNYQLVGDALSSAIALTTPFPDTDLGSQLQMVARLISVRSALGMSRQVFFVSTGNYDTHSGQIDDQQDNLSELSQALSAFYAATSELGLANNVTAFTASDFGRTIAANSSGTDHGWGGHHFVVGGAVRGQRFYGNMPSLLADNNPDDTGYGQIIPTLAVDQYAATLASWFGVGSSDIATILPNLGRYSAANLRFLG